METRGLSIGYRVETVTQYGHMISVLKQAKKAVIFHILRICFNDL